jgi:adenine-specific DNA-methyltransferase
VYDHLFRFFERYYDNWDFVSRATTTRETDSRAAPFAIPYNGEVSKAPLGQCGPVLHQDRRVF